MRTHHNQYGEGLVASNKMGLREMPKIPFVTTYLLRRDIKPIMLISYGETEHSLAVFVTINIVKAS